jgi:hypothetical protein
VPFTSPNFFWPERGVLGYSESLFLFSLPYAIARSGGFDPYLAFEIALIVFKAAGFFSMLWLLRSVMGLSRPVALMGSVLFTLSNLYYVSAGHSQLVTVAFTPLIVALACAAWRAYGNGRLPVAHAHGVACGILTALVLFTCFYIGWFTILTAVVCIAIATLIQIVRQRSFTPVSGWLQAAFARRRLFGIAALVFAVAILPFLFTYVPTLKNTGGRTFAQSLKFSTEPTDLFNVGPGSMVWGRLLKLVMAHPFTPGERMAGWPPIILLLTIGGGAVGASKLFAKDRTDSARHRTQLPIVVFSASFLCLWLLSIRMGKWSLWWLVFKAIPGGSAIHAPARLNFVSNVLLVLAASVILEQLRNGRNRMQRAAFWGLGIILVAEQLNLAPTHWIHRAAENALLAAIKPPLMGCSSFFLTAPAGPERSFAANQVDAMLVARVTNIPTLNGYSGFLPRDWNLLVFDSGYIDRTRRWAFTENVEQGLCGLDLRNGSWSTVEALNKVYTPGDVIDFRTGGNAVGLEGEGWAAGSHGALGRSDPVRY